MLIYDLEIANAIPDRNGSRAEGVSYCEGWTDYAGMGLAVVCCYDYTTARPRVFCSDNLAGFVELVASHDCVVGFNNRRFDDRVLAAQGIIIPTEKSYDLLQEIWRGLGLGPEFHPYTHGGYNLDAISRANFGASKQLGGADAPARWQRGHVGTVIDYCLADVNLTRRLLDRVIRYGTIIDPNGPTRLITVRRPGSY
jgi:DEAD/DEAH box helicase domain-containing protein